MSKLLRIAVNMDKQALRIESQGLYSIVDY